MDKHIKNKRQYKVKMKAFKLTINYHNNDNF